MKNIFILPTEKASKLVYADNKLVLHTLITKWHGKNQELYITSDEEIKELDYAILSERHIMSYEKMYNKWGMTQGRKIILTTDQNLIEDGVQAIDYDFLLWYIKNTSCEYVDVASELKAFDKNGFCVSSANFEDDYTKNIYYAVIPKVELKENPTTTVVREAMKIVSKDVRPPKLDNLEERFKRDMSMIVMPLDNENIQEEETIEVVYSEDDLINFMQFIISQESLENTSSVSKETARYYIEQFKKRQNEKYI